MVKNFLGFIISPPRYPCYARNPITAFSLNYFLQIVKSVTAKAQNRTERREEKSANLRLKDVFLYDYIIIRVDSCSIYFVFCFSVRVYSCLGLDRDTLLC